VRVKSGVESAVIVCCCGCCVGGYYSRILVDTCTVRRYQNSVSVYGQISGRDLWPGKWIGNIFNLNYPPRCLIAWWERTPPARQK